MNTKIRKNRKIKKTQKKARGIPLRRTSRNKKKPIRYRYSNIPIIKKTIKKKRIKSSKKNLSNKIISLIDKEFYSQYKERLAIIGLNNLNLLNSKNIKISYFRGLFGDFNTIIAAKFDLLRKGEHIQNLSYNSELEFKKLEKFDTKTKQICSNNKKTFSHCICCGKPITNKDINKLECDHVINLLDMLLLFEFGKTDIKNNFVFIHSICNNKKKNIGIVEFITKIYNNQFSGPDYYDEGQRISIMDRIKIINENILKPLNNNFTTPEKTLQRHTLLLNATKSFEESKQNLYKGLNDLEDLSRQSAANTLLQLEKNIQ